MSLLNAVALGLVQGITEFIPVSSSGHLILIDSFLGSNSSFVFDALLNVGTLAALLLYFRTKLWKIIISIIKDRNWFLVINVVISTVPAAGAGFLLADRLESGALRGVGIVAVMLFIGGLIMVLEPMFNPRKSFALDNLPKSRAFIVGVAQILALIPGTSRSGSTILAGRFSGLSHKDSAEYSFLIAIPILSGALLKILFSENIINAANSSGGGALVVGITTAFIVGYLAISMMIKYLRKHNLRMFGYYRIALSLLLLITLF